jgi:CDP-diacylglycerol--glycerol-3-phosphate 3-phosphatidyltransferase
VSDGYERTRRLARLRRQWSAVALLGAGLTAAGFLLVSDRLTAGDGGRWTLATGGVLAYELWLLRRHLDRNRPPDGGAVAPTLGVGTGVTLARGLAMAAVAGFLALPRPSGALAWAPAGLYALAAALDWVDGRLARWRGQVTALGAKLDAEFDGLGLLVASSLAVSYGTAPVWYLAVGLARPAYVAGLWLHRRRGGRVAPLPSTALRRRLAGLQMLACVGLLAPVTGGTLATALVAAALPFLAGFVHDFRTVTRE